MGGVAGGGGERAVDDAGEGERGVETGVPEATAGRAGLVALGAVGVEVGAGAVLKRLGE